MNNAVIIGLAVSNGDSQDTTSSKGKTDKIIGIIIGIWSPAFIVGYFVGIMPRVIVFSLNFSTTIQKHNKNFSYLAFVLPTEHNFEIW